MSTGNTAERRGARGGRWRWSPPDERWHRQLMRALALGRRSGTRPWRSPRSSQRVLREELGVKPAAETRRCMNPSARAHYRRRLM